MKTIIITVVILIGTISILNSQEKLNIDTSKKVISNGVLNTRPILKAIMTYISFEEGYFNKTDDVITGGEFIIDMHTIIGIDIKKEEANKSLVKHLKYPDFFNVSYFQKLV
ncbi:hypothetical protein [Psychroserpens mesophilus]|uniref:hypothetical protein n=1 Tax=Psychroserpens mesophilus TaxID=325473 RepID=UPI003D64D100